MVRVSGTPMDDADTSRANTSRAVVKTYVPAYQKEAWVEHAERLDMSQSEFVRSMVQAGRSGLEPDPVEDRPPTPNPRGNGMEDRLLDRLESGEHYSWDDLVDELIDDVEDRLEEALEELQADNRVQHSGRHGGYAVVEGSDER